MESDSFHFVLTIINAITFYPPSSGVITGIFVIFILLIGSALISASEVAFFSLNPDEKNKIKNAREKSAERVAYLLSKPEKLLATILITNNFINVGIVIISTFVTVNVIEISEEPVLAFVIQVVVVTFLIVLFGEIIPKLFANQAAYKFSRIMSYPLLILNKLMTPLSLLLVRSTHFLNRKLKIKAENISMTVLSDALDLTTGVVPAERNILKSIVKFSNINVSDIMKPRMDVVAVETGKSMKEIIAIINESGYSRIPVYKDTLDNIIGILYVKDLIPYIDTNENLNWTSLIRPSYFIPGTKKINALLQEFREKKIHLAIVVDEYGGTDGIVTLEDVLEEIVGEITDETDEIETLYVKMDENNYIFDAKVLLIDFYKALQIQDDIFENVRGDADTLAGLILEIKGEIPKVNEKLKIGDFLFTIVSADKRRIKKVKVRIERKHIENSIIND